MRAKIKHICKSDGFYGDTEKIGKIGDASEMEHLGNGYYKGTFRYEEPLKNGWKQTFFYRVRLKLAK